MKFRNLNKDEIFARLDGVTQKSIRLLLYKDARVDVAILDETIGTMGWQCSYKKIDDSLFCAVSIYDVEKNMWISKEDCGEKSFADEKKGEASDAFKRACFKWGIGIELYNSPDIFFFPKDSEIKQNKNGKDVCYTKFHVEHIKIENKQITELIIVDDSGRSRFTYGEILGADYSICPVGDNKGKKWSELPLENLNKALAVYEAKEHKEYVSAIKNAIKIKGEIK